MGDDGTDAFLDASPLPSPAAPRHLVAEHVVGEGDQSPTNSRRPLLKTLVSSRSSMQDRQQVVRTGLDVAGNDRADEGRGGDIVDHHIGQRAGEARVAVEDDDAVALRASDELRATFGASG